jgi:signal transduction histidine kinase
MRDQWRRYSGISALVAAILVPAFSVLDYFSYPAHFWTFLAVRIGCSAAIALLATLATSKGGERVQLLTVSWLVLVQAMILYMILVTEGASSNYYTGLSLAIFAMGIILPTKLWETILFCVGTCAAYASASLLGPGPVISPEFLGNIFFLSAMAIIASFATHFMGQRRYIEFLLSYQLEQRNQELNELDQRKTEFFANVSHELRTPLTLILAPVQELLEGGGRLTDAVASRLGVVRDNALRLLKLVNDLLEVIRLEEGKDRLDIELVDVNLVLRGMVDGMTHLADTKEITLERTLAPGHLVVAGDVRALEKIVVNLINNAIKFTGKGGKVRVESAREGEDVVVRVSDTGIGIPSDEQPHIFDRFHQVDGSSTRRFRGTGLGLALVKELTERMGGGVAVRSELGRGTTLTVHLPGSDEAQAVAQLPGAEEVDGLQEIHRLAERRGGLTVEAPDEMVWDDTAVLANDDRPLLLLVEDEPDMRRYLADILEDVYRLLQARTGSEGLRLALERRPDLILLDLMLPEMDGLEVCRRIREQDPTRRQKIMLLTARVDEQAKLTALDHGADDFLTKPFSSVEVKTRLRNLLASAILERDLADRNRRLQKTLAELEATQAQLIQSEKLNALGSLAAGLLHEINNPLNYSLTALQLIRGDPEVADNELMSEMLGDIDEGMQRIRAIVTDLRAFAYPTEAEKRRPFDLAEALESALRFTSHEVKGIEVLRAFPESARVLGSRSHITQVFINLLSNAAKAIAPVAGARAGRIRVAATVRGERLQVSVADNGVGMDGEVLTRIFEPFFTTRDVGEGMGLGLSISHTIVANHGGRLLAQSRRGEGSELVFDLPLAAGASH